MSSGAIAAPGSSPPEGFDEVIAAPDTSKPPEGFDEVIAPQDRSKPPEGFDEKVRPSSRTPRKPVASVEGPGNNAQRDPLDNYSKPAAPFRHEAISSPSSGPAQTSRPKSAAEQAFGDKLSDTTYRLTPKAPLLPTGNPTEFGPGKQQPPTEEDVLDSLTGPQELKPQGRDFAIAEPPGAPAPPTDLGGPLQDVTQQNQAAEFGKLALAQHKYPGELASNLAFEASGLPGATRLATEDVPALATLQPAPIGHPLAPANKMMSDILAASSPLVAGGLATAPIKTGIGLAAGAATGAGAAKVTKALGGSEDAQELARKVGYFIPGAMGLRMSFEGSPEGVGATASVLGGRAGMGASITPEAVRGAVKVGETRAGVEIPRNAPAQRPALPISPVQTEASAQTASAIQALTERSAKEQAAAVMAKGGPIPPPPVLQVPTPEAPKSPIANGHVSPELVDGIAKAIQSLPPDKQPAALLEAHQRMSEALTQQGKVIGPDGKLHVIENERQASKTVQGWLNDKVQEIDAQREQAAKAASKAESKPFTPSKQAGTAPEGKAQAGEASGRVVGSPKEQVIEEPRKQVDAQIASLKAGNIPAVFIPAGSAYRPQAPEGMRTVGVDAKHPGGGIWLYNPGQISASTIRTMAKNGDHGKLLGNIQSKADLEGKPTVVVQASKNGAPIQDSAVEAHPAQVQTQAQILQQRHPGATIEVKPVEQVLQERAAAASKEVAQTPQNNASVPLRTFEANANRPHANRGTATHTAGNDGEEDVLSDRQALQRVRGVSARENKAEVLPSVRERKGESVEEGKLELGHAEPSSEDKEQLPSVLENAGAEGTAKAAALSGLRKPEGGASSPRLQQPQNGDLAVPSLPHGGTRTPEIQRGARVTFKDREGKERQGVVKHANDLAVRIETDDGLKHEVAPSAVKATEGVTKSRELSTSTDVSAKPAAAGRDAAREQYERRNLDDKKIERSVAQAVAQVKAKSTAEMEQNQAAARAKSGAAASVTPEQLRAKLEKAEEVLKGASGERKEIWADVVKQLRKKLKIATADIVPGNSDTDVTELKKKYGIGQPADTEAAKAHAAGLLENLDSAEKQYDKLGTPNYVAADKTKELLPQWEKIEHRADVDDATHSQMSKLAYQIFQKKVDRLKPGSDVLLVTGPVAAGKTTATAGEHADLTYEVNLSKFEKATEHIDGLLAKGLKPEILYVYNSPVGSARRRASRMVNDGRPVRITKSVAQHIELPATIEKLHQKYGDQVQIRIRDNSRHGQGPVDVPIEDVGKLKYNGSVNELLAEQQAELDRLYDARAIKEPVHSALSRQNGQDHAEGGRESAAGGERLEAAAPTGKPVQSRGREEKLEPREPVPALQGKKTKIVLPDGSTMPAQYAVVSADDLQPSHDLAFNKNPKGLANERAYESSKEAQSRLVAQRQNLSSRLTINTSPTMVDGPPAMFPDGRVPGGNSRAWSIKGAYADRSGGATSYRVNLLNRAEQFGMTRAEIEKVKDPVLVRMVEAPSDEEGTRKMVSEMNKSLTGALGVSEKAVSAGKAISQGTLQHIGSVLDELGDNATLRDLMRDKGRELVKMLVSDGAITERERPQFVDSGSGGLSEEGKTFVERALIGSIVDEPNLMDRAPKSILNKLGNVLGELATLKSRDDGYNIIPVIREALEEHAQIVANNSSVDLHLGQQAMFGEERDPAVDAMTRALAEKPSVFKAAVRQFARDAKFDIEGQGTIGLTAKPSPAESFNAAFGAKSQPIGLFSPMPQPVFYSKAERVADDKLPRSGMALAFQRTLENNGVKPEEIKWLGLDDFLKNKGKVSKQEVMDFIRQNNVRVEEVEKGATAEPLKYLETNERRGKTWTSNEGPFDYQITHEGADVYHAERTRVGSSTSMHERFLSLAAAKRWLDELRKESGYGAKTKFQAHQLPGGKNYRELLLTLPESKNSAASVAGDSVAAALDKFEMVATEAKLPPGKIAELRAVLGTWDLRDENLNFSNPQVQQAGRDVIAARQKLLKAQSGQDASNFRSSHFDEPNVLAHIRFNDRTDAEGKKVLFLEEVQSDWHQKGRREGYQDASPITKLPSNFEVEMHDKRFAVVDRDRGITIANADTEAEAIHKALARVNRDRPLQGRVPDAPFKTSWHELSLKRMLRYAAENGYDKLAWTPGEVQNDRYDLSKHVSTVRYYPDTSRLQAYVSDDGRPIINSVIPREKLADYIGKEAAAKLDAMEPVTDPHAEGPNAAAPVKILNNADLKVGGSGMKGFYDKIIPDFLNKYGKKWGGRVGTTEVRSGYEAAKGNYFEQFTKMDNPTQRVPSLDITPSMKQSVMTEGQPLFKPEPIKGRSSQAEVAIARDMKFEPVKPGANVPSYVRVDNNAAIVISHALKHSFQGVSLEPEEAAKLTNNLRHFAGLMDGADANGAGNLRKLADVLDRHTDPVDGLNLSRMRPSRLEEMGTIGEELFHSAVQRRAGKGSVSKGVAWEALANEPEFQAMMPRIMHERNAVEMSKPEIVAEGAADLMFGDAPELSPEEQLAASRKLWQATLEKAGPEALEDAESLFQYLDAISWEEGIIADDADDNPGRKALSEILSSLQRGEGDSAGVPQEHRGRAEAQSGSGEDEGPERKGGSLTRRGNLEWGGAGIPDDQLDAWARSKSLKVEDGGKQESLFGSPEQMYRLSRLDSEGLPESALVPERRIEDMIRAGNQKLRRVFEDSGIAPPGVKPPWQQTQAEYVKDNPRDKYAQLTWRAHVESAIKNGDQVSPEAHADLERIQGEEAKEQEEYERYRAEQEAELDRQGKLFRPETRDKIRSIDESPLFDRRGEDEPISFGMGLPGLPQALSAGARLARGAADPIKNFIASEAEKVKQSRELQSGIYDLESQYQADVLRAVQLLKQVPGNATDEEQVYHHLEDPKIPLTKTQDDILEEYALPTMYESERIYSKLSHGGMPVENYVHRVVRDKGNFIDRVMQGMKGSGKGNILSKSAPATKNRTMMALEDGKGNRIVVAIKGGEVTQLSKAKTLNGNDLVKAAPLGSSSKIEGVKAEDGELFPEPETLSGRVFTDKYGKKWKIVQATTKEIERNTDIGYYKNAMASALTNYLSMRKAERAFDFLESFKASPDFKKVAFKSGGGNPPKDWRMTQVPQFRDYYFEPHTAEVLDWLTERSKGGNPTAWEKIGNFLRTSIFFNPLIHIPNITVHWVEEKGIRGWLPDQYPWTVKAGARAINAVVHQNKDFLEALDNGAPLQSQRDATRELVPLFFNQLAGQLEKDPSTAGKVANALGYARPDKLIAAIYKFSGKATWVTNDIAFMQAMYEKTARGMGLKDAISETAKHIPDYRLPTRIFDSRTIGKLMSNQNIAMFGAYHYGAMKSYGEAIKSLIGKSEAPSEEQGGRSKTGEQLHGADLLAMLGILTFLAYPLIDKLLKQATGNKDAHIRRAGAATVPYNLYELAKGEKTPTEVLESMVTPAVHTKAAVELGLNRDLRTGRKIYDPHAAPETIAKQVGVRAGSSIAPFGQAARMVEDRDYWKKFLYGLSGVTFPKQGAEKIAAEIAMDKMGTEAPTDEEKQKYLLRKKLLDAARDGDYEPLTKARDEGAIGVKEARKISRDALREPLEVQVENFSVEELERVYQGANDDQKAILYPILQRKLARQIGGQPEEEQPQPEPETTQVF